MVANKLYNLRILIMFPKYPECIDAKWTINVRYSVKFCLLEVFNYIEIAENFPIGFLDAITWKPIAARCIRRGAFFMLRYVQYVISSRRMSFVTCLVSEMVSFFLSQFSAVVALSAFGKYISLGWNPYLGVFIV